MTEVAPTSQPRCSSRAAKLLFIAAFVAGCGSDAASTPSGSSAVPTVTPPVNAPAAPTGVSSPTANTAGSSALPSGAVGVAGSAAMIPNGTPLMPAAAGGSATQPVMATGAAGSAAPGMTPTGTPNTNPADADIETCYELHAHGQPTVGDKSKYAVPMGETYTGFIFKAPWPAPVQGLRFRHLPDNAAVLHHWLLYSESSPLADGDIEACELAGPTGFLCGQASTRSLITGWAPGRGDFRLPEGVGLELPAPGALLAVEFHYFNTGTAMASDGSGVEICTTSKFRANTASVTWLGSQKINVPARMMGTASGVCNPLRKGMGANDPIHILFSWPHMHKLGIHMKSVVTHAAGAQEVMWDGPFSFDNQALHDTPVLLMAGDSVATTCTFMNTTDNPVMFGQSTTQEMCYNFTYAWPAHSLDNAGAELGGAENTCLQ
jgi:hypothetical protein